MCNFFCQYLYLQCLLLVAEVTPVAACSCRGPPRKTPSRPSSPASGPSRPTPHSGPHHFPPLTPPDGTEGARSSAQGSEL